MERKIEIYDPDIFHESGAFTVGTELEVRLIDSKSMMPANISPFVFEHLPDDLVPYVHKELLQSMVEIVTPVCRSAKEAQQFTLDILRQVNDIVKLKDADIAALATHPFEHKEDNSFYEDPRYDELAEELGVVLKNFLISGLHIHIAMPDEASAINAYNHTIHLLPLFVALSANSPFALGDDTKLQSYRSKIFERLPRAGIPEYFDDYRAYSHLIETLFDTGMIKNIKDVWWDVRIHQKFGTIELRVCDAFYDEERFELVVLLYQAIMMHYSSQAASREPYQISKQNKWNAVRHGLDGLFVEDGKAIPIREKLHSIVDELEEASVFEKLSCGEDAQRLHKLIDKPSIARKLQDIYHKNGNLQDAIKEEVIA